MNKDSLENLLMNEMKIIYKYLIKLGASKEDAEDIVQEALCKAIVNIHHIKDEKIKAWLFKVSINSYYNLYNKKKLRDHVLSFNDQLANELTGDILDEEVLIKERRLYIQKTFDQLKPSYRELLNLKYLMDYSYKEISDLLGMDESKVKTYLYRARNNFKQLWEESHYGRLK